MPPHFKREPIRASELVIGMKCGGSDGLSGITANPTVGAFSDKLISMGGSTILTEVPEMFGAEELLMNRCETEDLFNQTACPCQLNFKTILKVHNQTIYENPSPRKQKRLVFPVWKINLSDVRKNPEVHLSWEFFLMENL